MTNENLNIPKVYNDPIIYRKRKGDAFYPYKEIAESVIVQGNYALLTEVPNQHNKVKVRHRDKPLYEIEDGFIDKNQFIVDYTNGWIYLNESLQGEMIEVEYLGEGVYLFPDSRVYHTGSLEFPTVNDKFVDVDRSILVQKQRVDEQIRSVPQPSEVVDLRVDYNGKIYPVAKDRLDSIQKEVEDARVDAFDRKHISLKTRIDSMQYAVEEEFLEKDKENTRIWAYIDLIPGKIDIATGKLEEKINGETTLLQSQINLIPEKINLSVSELKRYTDGQISRSESSIEMLKDNIKLKVDVDGVTSAINLSKEGVRIDGRKITINGHTHIEKASIKSAHIESLDANKIRAGSIDTSLIRVHGGSSTEYIRLEGNTLESRGQVTTTWFGETTTRDVLFQIQDGYFRVRNHKENKSLYFFDYGISTYHKGFTPDSDTFSAYGSGVIDFHSHMYSKTARGLTLFSNRGILAMRTEYRGIIFDSASTIEFRSKREISIMNNNLRTNAIGIRSGTNFYIGTNSELRVVTNSFYNNGNPYYRDVRARDFKGRRIIDTGGQSYIYMGSNLGVRITSKGTNNLNRVYYRPIQASAFQVRSSRTSKENIRNTEVNGLEEVNKLNIVDFNYKGDSSDNTGFIAEESPEITSEDNEFVDLSKTVALLTKAVQELNEKVDSKLK